MFPPYVTKYKKKYLILIWISCFIIICYRHYKCFFFNSILDSPCFITPSYFNAANTHFWWFPSQVQVSNITKYSRHLIQIKTETAIRKPRFKSYFPQTLPPPCHYFHYKTKVEEKQADIFPVSAYVTQRINFRNVALAGTLSWDTAQIDIKWMEIVKGYPRLTRK